MQEELERWEILPEPRPCLMLGLFPVLSLLSYPLVRPIWEGAAQFLKK